MKASLVVRVWGAGGVRLLLGGFLSPAVALSLAGSLTSTLAITLMARGAWRFWSSIAISANGPCAHGGAQVLALGALLLRAGDLPWLLPRVLVPSPISGVATGMLANLVLLRGQWYSRGAV